MKRIAEWFAAVGAAASKSGKRLVAVVAAVAMLGGVAGVSATAMADQSDPDTQQKSGNSAAQSVAADGGSARAAVSKLNLVSLYKEDFQGAQANQLMTAYKPTYSDVQMNYNADEYWKTVQACNGFVADANFQGGGRGGCPSDGASDIRSKVKALGKLNGQGNDNKALSTNTDGGYPTPGSANNLVPADQNTMFQTDTPFPVKFNTDSADFSGLDTQTNRYIDFSVNAAISHPEINPPTFQFYMQQYANGQAEGGRIALGGPITYSEDDSSWSHTTTDEWHADLAYKTVEGEQARLIDANSDIDGFKIWLENSQKATSGNDGAIDDIAINDVTPAVDATYDPAITSIGGYSYLVLTVNNRGTATKSGWHFDYTLPNDNDLTIRNDVPVVNSCTVGDAKTAVTTNDRTINVRNGQLTGDSCTIKVPVTSSTAKTYQLGSFSNNYAVDVIADSSMISGSKTVTFTDGSVNWTKVDEDTMKALAGSEWTVTRQTTDSDYDDPNTVFAAGATATVSSDGSASLNSGEGSWSNAATDDNGSFSLSGLPWGKYTLKETKAPNKYTVSQASYTFTVNGDGVTADDPHQDSVTITGALKDNKISNIAYGTLTVTKEWADGNASHAADSVTVTVNKCDAAGASCDTPVQDSPVTLNPDNDWSKTFSGLRLGTYQVAETMVNGQTSNKYEATYTVDGEAGDKPVLSLGKQSATVVITNSLKSITLNASEFFKARSVIVGREWKNSDSFDFVLTGKSVTRAASCDVPMPAGSNTAAEACNKSIHVTDKDSHTFGDITYTRPGTYTYVINQSNQANYDITSSDALYRVTVTVTDENGLSASAEVVQTQGDDGSAVDDKVMTDKTGVFTHYIMVSSLPLTGGKSARDWLIYGGGLGLMALLAAAGYTVWRKRQLV